MYSMPLLYGFKSAWRAILSCVLPPLLFILLCAGAAHAVVDLPEETVTATGIDEAQENLELSPGAVSVVYPDDFQGEIKDLPQLLERMPGLHVIYARGRGGYTVATIRGSTSSQVSVYVDGILMNLGSESAVDLSGIPVENVERIEVYRGYIPARFGSSSMGGVINIVTKDPERQDGKSGNISLGTGHYGLWRAAANHSGVLGSGRYFIGVGYETGGGGFKYDNDNGTPFNTADDYGAKREHNDYANSEALFKWQDDNWRTRFYWVRNGRSLPLPAPGADNPGSPAGADLDTEKFELSLGRRQTSGTVDWGWRADYLRQDKKFDDPNDTTGGWGEQHNRYKTQRYDFTVDASTPLGQMHFLEFFTTYHDETLSPMGDIVNTLGGSSKMSEQTLEMSLQNSTALTRDSSLLLISSLRWNRDSQDDKLTWQAALNKRWYSGWFFKGSYGTYARGPNLYERYGDGAMLRPNEDLKWESGSQWDLGFGWQGKIREASLYAGLTYFVRDSDNLIEYVMIGPRSARYENVGEARVDGLELEFTADWENGWSVFGSGTWMNAEDRTPGSYRNDSPLPNRPEWEALLRVSRLWPSSLSTFAELHYIGDNYYDLAGNVKMADLTLLNAGVGYVFKNGIKWTVGVNDIFDAGPDMGFISTIGGPSRTPWYPLQGRTLYMNLSWSF